jgi:hypothetical protein
MLVARPVSTRRVQHGLVARRAMASRAAIGDGLSPSERCVRSLPYELEPARAASVVRAAAASATAKYAGGRPRAPGTPARMVRSSSSPRMRKRVTIVVSVEWSHTKRAAGLCAVRESCLISSF